MLIDEISTKGFMSDVLAFPPNVTLKMDKLVISGHSAGGMTAILTAMKDDRIKVCLPMDPWFFPFQNEHETICLKKTPTLSTRTETWFETCQKYSNGKFDCKKLTDAFFKNSKC